MREEILKKLGQKVDRRSFLRGSGLAAAAVIGVAAASSLTAFAQQQPPQQQDKKDDKKNDKKDEKKDDPGGDDPTRETKIDAQGREYRSCPQCGYNMYREGRTWTCENCGYSYVE